MNYCLYHFSEDPNIVCFEPRPLKTPVVRPEGMEWLNSPLVWAIDAENSPLYLFPRDCPRIIMRKLQTSTGDDITKYWTDPSKPLVAFIENGWVDRIRNTKLFRYAFEMDSFFDLEDVGMHVTQTDVRPKEVIEVGDLFSALKTADVEIQTLPDLSGLQNAWESSLHVSGIRLRNARNWASELFWLRPRS